MSIHFSNDLTELSSSCPAPSPVERRPGLYRNAGKRFVELAMVLVTAGVTVPVIAILAILIAFDGSNPFYRQKRLGRSGVVFSMWKLRTMVPDADARLADYLATNPQAKAEWESTQKLKKDPRITPIGRLLRKTSMDELPQLWNVLRGEMSLVGPRPMMVSQRGLYPGTSYFALRPGITGLWQISDRNNCAFSDRASFDSVYDRSVSLALDISILFRTILAVTRGTGY